MFVGGIRLESGEICPTACIISPRTNLVHNGNSKSNNNNYTRPPHNEWPIGTDSGNLPG
ncbi:hypothetical protein ANO14919_134860 [Xylariales sp. No.14919]|nr:hypothetical protein ANO14919_134860 [Xylariales sp. No.14919]